MHPATRFARVLSLGLLCAAAGCGRSLVTEPETPTHPNRAPTYDTTTTQPDSTQRCSGQLGSSGRCDG